MNTKNPVAPCAWSVHVHERTGIIAVRKRTQRRNNRPKEGREHYPERDTHW